MVDRLSVNVTSVDGEKLLGVPKINGSTGEAQAEAACQLLKEWKLIENVGSMCTDTTACNTGVKNGACVLLCEKLN